MYGNIHNAKLSLMIQLVKFYFLQRLNFTWANIIASGEPAILSGL